MRYPVSQESFDRRVVGLRQAIEAGVSLPPLIVNFSESALTLNDGNHRFQALKDLGSKTFAAIIWTTGDVDMTMFMTLYSGCCQEIGP